MPVCAAPPFAIDSTLSCDARWRAHDLLRLSKLPHFDAEPAWVRDALARAPFAVVRRAEAAEGFVAIGVRGTARSQRYGTWAASADIDSAIAPEALLNNAPHPERAGLPPFLALAALRHAGSGTPLASRVWGPTGSTGFELATGVPTVTVSSDLDLLIRAPEPLSRDEAVEMLRHVQSIAQCVGIRVDAQIETPAGGVALIEWAAGKERVMARHAWGPQLIADPWALACGGV